MLGPKLTVILGALPRSAALYGGEQELEGLYRLRRQIEPELAAEACLGHSAARLDWLERRIELFTRAGVTPERACRLHREFASGLLMPAMTVADHRTLAPMWQEVDRLMRDGLAVLCSHMPRSMDACAHRAVMTAYRTGEPAVVRTAVRAHLHRNERVLNEILQAAHSCVVMRGGRPG